VTTTFHSPTVAELIEVLKSFPEQAKWYGYDDETLIIVLDNGPKYGYQELAYISPEAKDA
jgi:hypothetical protein